MPSQSQCELIPGLWEYLSDNVSQIRTSPSDTNCTTPQALLQAYLSIKQKPLIITHHVINPTDTALINLEHRGVDALHTSYDREENVILFYTVNCNITAFAEACRKAFDDNELKHYSMLLQTSKSNITRVFKKDNVVLVLITKNNNIDVATAQIVGLVPVLFPEYAGLADDLAKQIGNREPITDITLIKLFKEFDFRKRHMQNTLHHLQSSYKNLKTSTTRSRLREQIERIRNIESELRQLYTCKNENERIIANTAEIDFTHFNNFVLNNPHITNVSTQNASLIIEFFCPMNWDVEAARIMKKSFRQSLQPLIQTVFIDQKYTPYWHATTVLRLATNEVQAGQRKTGFNNLHLHNYSCYGENKAVIKKALAESDLLTAIGYVANSSANLNFYDGTVLTDFKEELCRLQHTNFAKKDDKWFTISQILEAGEDE